MLNPITIAPKITAYPAVALDISGMKIASNFSFKETPVSFEM